MTYRKAKAFIKANFRDGEYIGDNPYLAHVSLLAMLNRWFCQQQITIQAYLRLRREFCNLS